MFITFNDATTKGPIFIVPEAVEYIAPVNGQSSIIALRNVTFRVSHSIDEVMDKFEEYLKQDDNPYDLGIEYD